MMQEWFEKYILDNFTEAERAMYASIWYSDWWSDGVQSEEERRKLIDKQVIFMYEYSYALHYSLLLFTYETVSHK